MRLTLSTPALVTPLIFRLKSEAVVLASQILTHRAPVMASPHWHGASAARRVRRLHLRSADADARRYVHLARKRKTLKTLLRTERNAACGDPAAMPVRQAFKT